MNRLLPTKIKAIPRIELIACGKQHSLAYNENGQLFAMGRNTYGQLGTGDFINRNVPSLVKNLTGIQKLEAGPASSFAIREDHSLFVWGLNSAFELMVPSPASINTPQKVEQVYGVSNVAGGDNFSLVVNKQAIACPSNPVDIQMLPVPTPTITQEDLLLTINQGSAWQWYLNGSPIPAATDSSYIVSTKGVYSVFVAYENACSYLTGDYNFAVSIENVALSSSDIVAYPNPSKGTFELVMNLPEILLERISSYEILDLQGRRIEVRTANATRKVQDFNLSHYPKGQYFIVIQAVDCQQIVVPIILQ